ncbi:MAG: fumarylacetoacetate hydrolase family protein [Acidobacteriota bacterium]|jgi:2-keto-4-pentenoate hydratase/2-oxohepta-3-ene-1,7-dioic acid hydratase in catechol pathway
MLYGRVLFNGAVQEVTWLEDGKLRSLDGRVFDDSEVSFLPPCRPTKIVCVGRNYVAHAAELGNAVPERPLLFLKPPSALLGHGGVIRRPGDSSQVEYEGEIGVVMARSCKDIGPEDDPMSLVAGFTAVNDVTARDLQRLDVQFTRAKSFDTFCPVGPFINDRIGLEALEVQTFHNNRRVQSGRSSEMAFSIPDLIRYISRVMTLNPGDLIATGTPAGVGALSPGDVVAVEAAGVRLENRVE